MIDSHPGITHIHPKKQTTVIIQDHKKDVINYLLFEEQDKSSHTQHTITFNSCQAIRILNHVQLYPQSLRTWLRTWVQHNSSPFVVNLVQFLPSFQSKKERKTRKSESDWHHHHHHTIENEFNRRKDSSDYTKNFHSDVNNTWGMRIEGGKWNEWDKRGNWGKFNTKCLQVLKWST